MDFILACTVGLILLFCMAVTLDWFVYHLRYTWSLRPSHWLARFRSWRYAQAVKGLTLRRMPGPAPSLGSLRVSRSRSESLNGPPEPPAGA
jgi:hypothetical protein